MKSSKELTSEIRERKDQYKRMRQSLLDIVDANDSQDADKISAIRMIFELDNSDVPMPKSW